MYLCLYLSETWHGPEYPDLYQCHVGNWCKIVFLLSFANCVCVSIFICMCISVCIFCQKPNTGQDYHDLYQWHIGNWGKIVFFVSFVFVNCICICICICICNCISVCIICQKPDTGPHYHDLTVVTKLSDKTDCKFVLRWVN